MKLICVWLLLPVFASSMSAAGIPLVNQPLVPASTKPGSAAFTLTVNGTGFTPTAVVNWNGSSRPTAVISGSSLQAAISAADVAKAGTAAITVTNPGGLVSNFVFFPVTLPTTMIAMAAKQVFANCAAAIAGDFNGDGKLDVAWTDTATGSLNLSLGDGKGGFAAPIATPLTFFGPPDFQLIVGDFNSDGKLDVAGTTAAGRAYLLLGNGDGTFTPSYLTPGGRLPFIAASDFGQTGSLAFYQEGDNLGSQWFSVSGQQYPIAGFAVFPGIPAIGDFNGDGKIDLAVPISTGGGQLYLGNGDGTFAPSTVLTRGQYAASAADFNRDGKLDFVTDIGCVSLGNGDGTFRDGGCSSSSSSGITGIGDFNGDGILDVAAPSPNGSGVLSINLGKGDGTFSTSFSFPAGMGGLGSSGAIGDFNGDGKLDVITGGGFLLLQTTASLSSTSLTFGNQNIGTSSLSQVVTLTNIGSTALPLQAANLAGANPGDFIKSTTCTASLAAGASCTITVKFKPKAAGSRVAALNVRYTGVGSPQAVALSGTGLLPPSVSLAPSNLTFSTELVGTTSPSQTATLTNTGTVSVSISKISLPAPFHQTNNCPASLAAAASCQIQVSYAPTARGGSTGKLSITDNVVPSPQTASLLGAATVVTISPIGVNFGGQKVVTSSAPIAVTLTNTSASALTITQIGLSGANPGDFSQTNTCGTSLPAKGSCTVKAVFKPTAVGSRAASLTVTDSGGASPQGIPLAGTGQ